MRKFTVLVLVALLATPALAQTPPQSLQPQIDAALAQVVTIMSSVRTMLLQQETEINKLQADAKAKDEAAKQAAQKAPAPDKAPETK